MQAMELSFRRAVRLVATPTPTRETATRASRKVKAATAARLWILRTIMVIKSNHHTAKSSGSSRRFTCKLLYNKLLCQEPHPAIKSTYTCLVIHSFDQY